MPSIASSFSAAFKGMKGGEEKNARRTDQNLSLKLALGIILTLLVALVVLPSAPISLPGALLILVFGLFFGAVTARIVGIVGSSNTPVSGMTIATMLLTALIFQAIGVRGAAGMIASVSVGTVTCIIMSIAGDTSQDLKTGFLLGATPKKQQIGEVIGVMASALAIGGTLYLLDSAWGFGSEELGAPQATLMKMIIEGVMSAELPWNLVFVGVFIAILVEVIGIPVLPFAIGVYLPVQLNACIMIGGILRLCFDKMKANGEAEESKKKEIINDGILFCSGMIAGEGLVGILLALLAVFGADQALDISGKLGLPEIVSNTGSIVVFGLIILTLLKFSLWKKRDKGAVKHGKK